MKVNGTNISMIRGDTETITVSCQDIDGTEILFETGDKIYFTIKENTKTAVKILQKLITTFQDGKAIIEIDPIDTKSLKYQTFVYDVQWVDESGRVTTVVPPSKFVIADEVTYE